MSKNPVFPIWIQNDWNDIINKIILECNTYKQLWLYCDYILKTLVCTQILLHTSRRISKIIWFRLFRRVFQKFLNGFKTLSASQFITLKCSFKGLLVMDAINRSWKLPVVQGRLHDGAEHDLAASLCTVPCKEPVGHYILPKWTADHDTSNANLILFMIKLGEFFTQSALGSWRIKKIFVHIVCSVANARQVAFFQPEWVNLEILKIKLLTLEKLTAAISFHTFSNDLIFSFWGFPYPNS